MHDRNKIPGPYDGSGMENKLEALATQAEQMRDAVRVALADADYARGRAQADLAHAGKFSTERFAKALLPFKDALETAMVIETADVGALKAGLEISLKQLQAAFENNGLMEVSPRPGEQFDPHRHRSLVKLEPGPANVVVVDLEQKGYTINGRLIRPAVVTVIRAR